MGHIRHHVFDVKGGGNVIIPTPYWTAYDLIAKSLGAKTKLLRTEIENEWKVDLGKLENMIDKDTRMIILNNPNNPTSKVIDAKTLDGIVEIANKKGVTILSDEVYGTIAFTKTKSILEYDGGLQTYPHKRLLQNFHHDRLAHRLHNRQQNVNRQHN